MVGQQQRAELVIALGEREELLVSMESEVNMLRGELDRAMRQIQFQEKSSATYSLTIGEQDDRLRQRGEAVETLTSEVRLLNRRLSELHSSHTNVGDQMRDTSEALARTTERLSLADKEVANLLEGLASSQREKDRADEHCSQLQRQIEVSNKRAGLEREDLRRSIGEKEVLEGRVQEFRVLITSMEGAARSHSQRASRLAVALEEGEQGIRKLEEDNGIIREQLREKEGSLSSHEEVLRNLDEERDRLQALLDGEQEQRERSNQVRQKQSADNMQLRQVLERTEKRLQSVSMEAANSQRQCAATEARVSSLKEETLDLKRRMSQKNSEVGGAAEDLMLMTRENHALTSELAETTSERDRLHHRATELTHSLASKDQTKRGIELERADLLTSYRAVLGEKRQLEVDLMAMSAGKERAGLAIQQLQEQVNELRGINSNLGGSESRWHAERISQTRQIERINDELVRSQREKEVLEADGRRTMQEIHGLRSTNIMLTERVQMVIKRATATADANKVLSVRLAAVERERYMRLRINMYAFIFTFVYV